MEIRPFVDVLGSWRWHIVDPGNGKIILTSGEAFFSKANVKRAIDDFQDEAGTSLPVVWPDE